MLHLAPQEQARLVRELISLRRAGYFHNVWVDGGTIRVTYPDDWFKRHVLTVRAFYRILMDRDRQAA